MKEETKYKIIFLISVFVLLCESIFLMIPFPYNLYLIAFLFISIISTMFISSYSLYKLNSSK